MKKSILAIFSLLAIWSIHASEPAVVYGTWERGAKIKDSEVKLYRVELGRLDEVASSKVTDNYCFGFAFEPQGSGFYVIGSGYPTSAQGKYAFYFKPGDRLNIAVNDSSYVLTGHNTAENIALTKWHNEVSLMEYKAVYPTFRSGYVNGQSSTYVDFFPLLPEYEKKAPDFQSNTGNAQFEAIFKQWRRLDLIRYAYTFILTPRKIQPNKPDFIDFYTKMDVFKWTSSADLLQYPFGIQTLQNVLTVQNMLDGISGTDNTKRNIEKINNDTVKGEFVVNLAEKLRTYTDLEQFNKEYGKYILTLSQKRRINDLTAKLTQGDQGSNTLDFSGTDVTGKKVSLSDFKGKVVVVDVWATWCGPCRKEIPALKTLEKEYHNKDVVFLSVSLDEIKDKQKWIDFVKQEALTGVQIFGGNGLASDVAKLYNIKGIPRFMVFAKSGKIVTDNAPRPTNPSLKNMIEEQLKK